MSSPQANPLLHLLLQQLEAAEHRNHQIRSRNEHGTIIQVPGTGKAISSAYEQLRNAAEYTEEHLLLQRAIRRFYHRNLSFFSHKSPGNIGEELVVELTQAGYLQNHSVSHETAATILHLTNEYMHAYWQMRDSHVSREDAMEWTLAILSVETEEMLNPHAQLAALAQFGYQHYLQLFPRTTFIVDNEDHENYEISLYIAVHLALLKSDISVVRHDLMRMYNQSPANLPAFVAFNKTITELYTSKLTGRLKRAVMKYGAPLRVLKSMVDDHANLTEVLKNREIFLAEYQQQVNNEYRDVKRRLNKGIIKSIIFIFITKVIIGIGIEVPYDLIVHHMVALVPLAINLLFPPAYMALLWLGLKVPSQANAQALAQYIDKTLYSHELPVIPHLRDANKRSSLGAKFLYTLLFFVPFALTVYILWLLHFNIVQAIIFFVFFSTASFLGFRLSRLVRELEIVTKQNGFLSSVRDFFYLPFIVVGQWLSSKYAKINAVAYVLDIAIEMPLKTVLRLLRQWTRFLNEKHEDIY
ncbi:MAG TPA: hypothetical protein VD735_07785 [Candidatus Saccharimonadales bacterium]|nr:hypothetical protein [Candidatus Saccharimonadales bacterium]